MCTNETAISYWNCVFVKYFKMQSFTLLQTRYPENQVYVCVWKTERTGHKMPFFINIEEGLQRPIPLK